MELVREATAEYVANVGLARTQGYIETLIRDDEDFAEYVDDPATHHISWRMDVVGFNGRVWTDWNPDLGGLRGVERVRFVASYEPTGAEEPAQYWWKKAPYPRVEFREFDGR